MGRPSLEDILFAHQSLRFSTVIGAMAEALSAVAPLFKTAANTIISSRTVLLAVMEHCDAEIEGRRRVEFERSVTATRKLRFPTDTVAYEKWFKKRYVRTTESGCMIELIFLVKLSRAVQCDD
jgi:hypothetical protein